jgi:hypothetical protein
LRYANEGRPESFSASSGDLRKQVRFEENRELADQYANGEPEVAIVAEDNRV